MTTPALGYIPPMTKGITDDPAYVIPLVEMLEEEGIESIWTVEHVIMADQYEPLYPYSEDGKAPTADSEDIDPDGRSDGTIAYQVQRGEVTMYNWWR